MIKKKNYNKIVRRAFSTLMAIGLFSSLAHAAVEDKAVVSMAPQSTLLAAGKLKPMTDEELTQVTGQALLVADSFAGQVGSDITFYRMTLDAKLEMNMNIDHLQLGCGGVNGQLAGGQYACDVDIENVRFMGTGAGQPGADGAGAAVDSGFLLQRPYLEFAVKNDNDPTQRELVGIKIGSQRAQGYMGIGRFIDGVIDLDGGGTHNCTTAPNNLECHRGINRLSGWLDLRLEGEAYGCFGLFGCTENRAPEDQDFLAAFDETRQIYGTRMTRAYFGNLPMASFLGGLELQANINAALRYVHGTLIDATEADPADFFLSFQRERIAYRNYAKNNWSETTNTGWWLNIPGGQMTGLRSYGNETDAGALGGINYVDIDFAQRPPDNCYGALEFC